MSETLTLPEPSQASASILLTISYPCSAMPLNRIKASGLRHEFGYRRTDILPAQARSPYYEWLVYLHQRPLAFSVEIFISHTQTLLSKGQSYAQRIYR